MSLFRALNPATGEALEPGFTATSLAELEAAAARAAAAFDDYSQRGGAERGRFLRAIAAQLEARKPELVARAQLETALPAPRLENETARTCAQLRMFAALVEDGSWVDARLDFLDAVPAPGAPRKPDLRSLLRPLGPVAVFGASNFPIAFSVAGGDTASALAAGCPVLVKAHPAHPGASAVAADAIRAAVRECGLPEGVFALLYDAGIEIGAALVRHPAVRAVGFTGSQAAGRALMDLAAARPEPIPVYAEMGSTNPVFLLPEALAERGPAIAQGLHTSVTLGAGQFCTKPGLVMLEQTAAPAFAGQLAELLGQAAPFTLLTPGIARNYRSGAAARGTHPAVRTLTAPPPASGLAGAAAMLFQTDAAALTRHPELAEELFGPATVLVAHAGGEELLALARGLHGHLTATVHGTESDLRRHAALLRVLEQKVGRIVFNGYPTGVEVCDAMMHGGPYPASSSRETSVGAAAILRFTRRVCYQDAPEFLLPPDLRRDNPLRLRRRRDGQPENPPPSA